MVTVRHKATLGNRLVDIIKLREFMDKYPIDNMDVNDESLKWQIEPSHHYWNGEKGISLGPDMLLKIENWENAETEYPDFAEHIRKVKKADLNYPIWICNMPDMKNPSKRIEIIFDGMHRYTKAVLLNKKEIKVKKVRLEDIPEDYYIS